MTDAPFFATSSTTEALNSGHLLLELQYEIAGIAKRSVISRVIITPMHAEVLADHLIKAAAAARNPTEIEDGE